MRVSDAIPIGAPAEVVWAVTVDVERWPEWTPTMTSVSRLDTGPLKLGSIARITQPMQPPSEWVVTELVDGRRFAWETLRWGLHMIATHEIVPEGAGTRNVLHLAAEGAVAWLLRPLLRFAFRRVLARENRGLERRCEDESERRRQDTRGAAGAVPTDTRRRSYDAPSVG